MEHSEDRTEELVALAARVVTAYGVQGLTCATAESCTGGLVGHLLTEIAGSSASFMGAAVTYSYEAKEKVLGVDAGLLEAKGAVSAEVAAAMAAGARELYEVDVAVAITGVAGPGGGTPDKPVGLVHLHLSGADGCEEGRRKVWPSDRRGNKELSAREALTMLAAWAASRRGAK
ncbi:MAG: CinA family protein [Caldilineaceae bacterium SB0665_bin_21]|nr:CinA family protein [Caldilineaceae bacterium SB0665_bin_21]MYA03330.1 CinA family protein [Caldilineaceae bacterium SB0664_bin_22]MYC62811.1 CinA family protein [Caldilineaceae bacterium SB0661_bin_34]